MSETQLVQMLISGQSDQKWFQANLITLKDKYDDRFIALKDKAVIESDHDLNSLMTKLKQKNIDTKGVFIEFVSKVKSIL